MKTKNLKKTLKGTFVVLLAVCTTVISCKKENTLNSNPENQIEEVSIKNGTLKFTKTAFADLMTKSHQKQSTELINKLIGSLSGHEDFISLKQEALNIGSTGKLSAISLKNNMQMSISGPSTPGGPGCASCLPPPIKFVLDLDSLVADPYFASVLSPDGEVEVDNTIYKVTEHGTFLVASEDKAELDQLIVDIDNGLDLSLNVLSEGDDVYKLILSDKILVIDTYGKISPNNGTIISGTSPTNTIIDFPVGPNVFTNVDVYEFNDSHTWVGKAAQNLFGRDHFKTYNNTDKTRLKVNFYSTNWGIFASVGARSVIQTRGWTGLYRPLENFDEMRLGWSNVVIELDLPALNPVATQPGDFWNSASNALKSKINFKLLGIEKDFLVYRVDQILAFDQITHSLPYDLNTKLNNLIRKLNGAEINIGAMLESGLDKQAVERLVKYVKAKAEDKSKEVAFTNYNSNPTTNTIGKIIIPMNWEYRYNQDGNAVMSQTFDFQTAIVGIKNGKPTFSLAKTVKIITGEVTALGKLNGEWIGMSVVKK